MNRTKAFPLFSALTAFAMLLAPGVAPGQSVLPIDPQPADMPAPGAFTVTTISYQGSATALVSGHGKTFGRIGGDFFSYDSATPGTLTVNFTTAPLQSILGVDNSSGAYVGQTLNSLGYLATPDGSFVTDPAFPVLPGPLPLNHFLIGYGSVFVGVQNGQVVGTASVEIGTSIPLNGGDGTSISGPPEFYQVPIVGVGSTIILGQQGIFTRVMGFRGTQVVGDMTTNINYNPSDSSPNPWNTVSSAWMMDVTQPGSGRVLAGIPSMAAASDGLRQGGWVGLRDGTGNYHATLWSGSAASSVDLNPPNFFDSRVSGMSSEFQAGDGWLGGPANSPGAMRHALLWRGTADSVVDLNQFLPPSILGAQIIGVDADGNIVGSYTITPVCPTCNVTPPPQQVWFLMNPTPSSSLASLTFDSSSPAPGGSVTGTVTLGAAAAAGGVSVSFTSSDSTLVPAPAGVVIPEGQTSISFPVPTGASTVSNFMLAPAPVTLVAHTTYSSRSAILTVTPATPAAPIVSLALTPTNAAPGDSVIVTVTLSQPAPTGGVIVNFNSLNTNLITTPPSLIVPAGASSASFTFSPIDANDVLFWGPIQATLEAATGNVIKQASLTVTRVLKPGMVILGNPQNGFTSVQGEASGIGFIPLNSVAQVAGTITLSNNNPAITLPATVSFQPGGWSVAVPWTALPVATLTTGTATATLNGFSSTDTLSVTASPSPLVQSLVISLPPTTQTFSSGQTTTATVTLSGPAFLGGMTVSLASDTPAAAQVPSGVIVPAGATSANFTVTAGQVSGPTLVNITATLAGLPPLSTSLTVIPGPPLAVTSYTLSPFSIIGPGVAETGTVSLNQPAPAGGVVVSLSASNPQPAKFPATVTFAQGQSSANFTVQGNSVSAATTISLIATYKGSLAPLGTSASTALTVAPTDTLHVTKATWSTSSHALTVTATSTNPQATITALNANGNVPLGTMTNLGNGSFNFQATLASISAVNIKSNLGGSTGQGVTVVP